jgi:hypothetical protein
MLEDEFAEQKTSMKVAHKDTNIDLNLQKKNQEEEDRRSEARPRTATRSEDTPPTRRQASL